jgi:hypothetical protein
MDTAKPYHQQVNDVYMQTAKGWNGGVGDLEDVRMETARPSGSAAVRMRPAVLQEWERDMLNSSEVKRKATVAQMCKLSSWAIRI